MYLEAKTSARWGPTIFKPFDKMPFILMHHPNLEWQEHLRTLYIDCLPCTHPSCSNKRGTSFASCLLQLRNLTFLLGPFHWCSSRYITLPRSLSVDSVLAIQCSEHPQLAVACRQTIGHSEKDWLSSPSSQQNRAGSSFAHAPRKAMWHWIWVFCLSLRKLLQWTPTM